MNRLIIDQFTLLVKQIEAEYLNAQVENEVNEIKMHKFRLMSTKKILAILKKIDFDINSFQDVVGIPGIGKGTINRIKEIIDKGVLSEIKDKYDKKKQSKIDSIQELENVIGIGSSNAKKFVTEHNIYSISDLKKAIKSKKIQVSNIIKLGLKYYGIVQDNIPRKEISVIEKYIVKEAHKIDPELEIIICGSYRRGKPTSGDIDILVYHPKIKIMDHIKNSEKYNLNKYLEILVNNLSENNFLIDHLTDQNYIMKYMGFCKYNNFPVRRIDIRFIPYSSLYTAMLYFTGPYELNTYMRSVAKKKNMILNEYGLYKIVDIDTKKKINIKSEEDVFDILEIDYLEPDQRESFNSH